MGRDTADVDWTEPGIYEVAPGVHRIPLPLPNDGLRAVNVYAIVAGDRVALIDSGWALEESQTLLAKSLDQIGYGLSDITDFFVTHIHRDHYTQAVVVRRLFGSRISLGEGERASLTAVIASLGKPPPVDLPRLRRRGAGHLVKPALAAGFGDHTGDGSWQEPDEWLSGDVSIPLNGRSLRAVHTPGHTQGHVVFIDNAAGLLFAGDHVLPRITPSIGLESTQGRSPLDDYLASLRLVRSMPDARLLPAHGPVTPSVHARVDELLDHHATRLDATAAAVTAGAQTAYEAAQRLTWTRRERRLADLDLFNQILAIGETDAHLTVLVNRGMLAATEVDGVTHYRLA